MSIAKGRGRKRKPTELQIVAGNPGHRPLSTLEAPEGQPKPPTWLSARARRKWREVLSWCLWLTPADGDMLMLYADAYDRYRMAQELANQGALAKTPDGRPIKNPAWTCVREAFWQMRSAASELGISPSGRAAVGAGGTQPPGRNALYDKYFG